MSVGLPPIPSLGGQDAHHDPGGTDLVTLLVEEHARIDRLCAALADEVDPARRRGGADVLVAMISRHLSAEEQYLYPAVRAAVPDDGARLAQAGLDTDETLQAALVAWRAASSDDPGGSTSSDDEGGPGTGRDRALDTVAAGWRGHRALVETTLLPRLRAAATPEELIRLGNRAAIAEEAAPTRPHPHAPSRPPWNRVTAPAIGVVDKVRDLASGRTTYPEDLPSDDPATVTDGAADHTPG
ncbi:hemerythrin domain-containing protein [Solwaraspora sp. WMMD791]|uniref:hemerythrin domain-containing protein n=1 Tax=Solwaraspora sp. WMMD791 TaxID=3016086 RepID=UPI00249C4337|nr:hemerythrin domain-containing protein [Solwaraspora sp. WMMD791]WFE28590.1 hemerythrin domain-containing protein [Solwaraspora sp. WMMD791]